jgi:succinylglutamate desuccinylase
MHGNEITGWEAVRLWLRRYRCGGGDLELPRRLSLFVGNVAAASQGLRHLSDQPDYNRVWPGCEFPLDAEVPVEHEMMNQVVETMRTRGVFASVDVHNNTGLNPHYACVNVIDNRFLHLATLFGRTVVYFIRPCGVQSMAMARLCPSVTLECGKPGQQYGTDHALQYLDACLHLAEHSEQPLQPQDIDLFHTVATVKVPNAYSLGFSGDAADIKIAEDLEYLNFREIPPGTVFAEVNDDAVPFDVRNERGMDVSRRYFSVEKGLVKTRLPVMPSMLTNDTTVIHQDCFCYLMERYDSHLPEAPDRPADGRVFHRGPPRTDTVR